MLYDKYKKLLDEYFEVKNSEEWKVIGNNHLENFLYKIETDIAKPFFVGDYKLTTTFDPSNEIYLVFLYDTHKLLYTQAYKPIGDIAENIVNAMDLLLNQVVADLYQAIKDIEDHRRLR